MIIDVIDCDIFDDKLVINSLLYFCMFLLLLTHSLIMLTFLLRKSLHLYDTFKEQAHIASTPVGQTLCQLKNKRSEKWRTKRQSRRSVNEKLKLGRGTMGQHQPKFIAAHDAQIQKLKDAESIVRHHKLMLPAVQVGEPELDEHLAMLIADKDEGTSNDQ